MSLNKRTWACKLFIRTPPIISYPINPLVIRDLDIIGIYCCRGNDQSSKKKLLVAFANYCNHRIHDQAWCSCGFQCNHSGLPVVVQEHTNHSLLLVSNEKLFSVSIIPPAKGLALCILERMA